MARFDGGWVKIHRKAILGDIGSNYLRGGLFMALIAMANLRQTIVSWKGKPRKLERGELVTSIGELAELGEIDRKSVVRHLNYLALRETIVVEKTHGGTLIKIPNFDKYQFFDAEGSQTNPISADNRVPNEGTHIEEVKKETRKEGESTRVDRLPRLALIWNEHGGALQKVQKSNATRDRKASARFAEAPESEWIDVVQRIARSSFCTGKNDRGWKATFDWLLQPETRLKVLEGKYDDRTATNGGSTDWAALKRKYEGGASA